MRLKTGGNAAAWSDRGETCDVGVRGGRGADELFLTDDDTLGGENALRIRSASPQRRNQ